jgi:hypothetical protein
MLFQFKMLYSLKWDAELILNSEKVGIACYSNWVTLESNSRTLALYQSVHCICYLITRIRKLFCVDNRMLLNHVLLNTVTILWLWLIITGFWIGFIDHSFTITCNHNNWTINACLGLAPFCSVLRLTGTTTDFILIWTASNIAYPYPGKRLVFPQRRVGFQESISMETCLSARSLAMGLHVTIHLLNRAM